MKSPPEGEVSPAQVERMDHTPQPFAHRYGLALADSQLQNNLLRFQRSWRDARDEAWDGYAEGGEGRAVPAGAIRTANPNVYLPLSPANREFEALRDRLAEIKDEVIENLPQYVDRFQEAAEAAGVHVYRARTAEDLNSYVLDLCRRHGISHVVKSKTMVSEETTLNGDLEEAGIEVVETDLGEWIVQLAHERPSHMVMPAIHKSRQQVASLFSETTGKPVDSENIQEQAGVARRELRREFLEGGMGISGANALVAESGSVMFICNEGNARLVTSLPRVHVVLAGIEKLVPDFDAAMLHLRLVARSATAQTITSYTTFLSGPPEEDKEMHIVLLDNGRSEMRADPQVRDALRCIRCAACANVCPPYAVVGGHVFGYIYSGAIGLVNTPYHHGIEAGAGPQSLCVSCNACATVCPVGIPLPQQILAVRARTVQERGLPAPVRLGLRLWSNPHAANAAMRVTGLLSRPLAQRGFLRLERVGFNRLALARKFAAWRTPPAPSASPARDRIRARTSRRPEVVSNHAAGLRVVYFVQCITDRLFPDTAMSIVRVLDALGIEVVTPPGQHCCGLPAIDAGDLDTGRRMAKQTMDALERTQADYIITGGASCAVAMLHEYQGLFVGEPEQQARAAALKRRVMDFTTFVDKVAQLEPGAFAASGRDLGPVTYHNFCQSANILGIDDAPTRIIRDVLGLELRDLPERSVCCGFGGSTSAVHPDVSAEILKRKLENVEGTGATTLVTDNPGCMMHLRGGLDAGGSGVSVLHIADLIAACLPER
ncbi:MAG: LUD domain-containing protein [Chloroflexia bacterium]